MLYEEFLKNFGIRMKYIRMQKRLTQIELADLLNADISHIGKIEQGKRNVTLKTIHKIAAALEVEPASFFDFKV